MTSASRYDAAPLLRLYDDLEVATETFAKALRTSTRTVWRRLRRGLSWSEADVLAVAVGLHPVDLWPSWFADVADET